MALPTELQKDFKQTVKQIQEEKRMPYLTSFERDGMIGATRSNVIEVLETRFETIDNDLVEQINQIEDLDRLKQLHKQAILIGSVVEFKDILNS